MLPQDNLTVPIGIGIDFEDITQTPAYRSLNSVPEISIPFESIADRLLRLFEKHEVSATFFVVSDLAEVWPDLIRRIASAGHEIASHSATHPSLPDLSTSEKRQEIEESKASLEAIVGAGVEGFRAPTGQLDDEVYRLLAEAGYSYSSSVIPAIPIPGFYSNEYNFRHPRTVETSDGVVTELPLAVSPLIRLPVSGAWIRLLGRTYVIKSLQHLLKQPAPVLTYSHPWEFVSLQDTPLPRRNRIRTGEWLFDTYEKILQLDTEYCPVSDLVNQIDHA